MNQWEIFAELLGSMLLVLGCLEFVGKKQKMEEDTREALKNQIKFNEEKEKRAKREEVEYMRSIKPPKEKSVPIGTCDECAHDAPLASMCQKKTILKQNRSPDPITNTYSRIFAAKKK